MPGERRGPLPRLVVLTNRAQLHLGRGLLRTLRECAEAGLRAVVVREHDLDPGARGALIAGAAEIPGLTVLSSRLPDAAAVGVHLASDQPLPEVGGCWGRSCHRDDDVARAAAEGAQWVTLSPYATTASKPGYGPPLPAVSWQAARRHGVPVYALGGVTPDNADAARAAGATGVAVMGAVMAAAEPADVVADLLAGLEESSS